MNEAFDSVCFKGSIVSQSARFVYLCLCKHADNTHQTCFPSLNRIAQIVGKSISTVKRAMRELCNFGAVERTPRFRKDGGQTSNLYKIVPCKIEDILNEADEKAEEHFEMDESAKEDILYPVSDNIEPARACTSLCDERYQGGEPLKIDGSEESETYTAQGWENVHNNIEIDNSLLPHSIETENIPGRVSNYLSNQFGKIKKYIRCINNRVPSWFNCLNQTICGVKSNIFKKNEPGGGQGRPPGNLSI